MLTDWRGCNIFLSLCKKEEKNGKESYMDNFILHFMRTHTNAHAHPSWLHLSLRSTPSLKVSGEALWRVRLIVSDCKKTRRHIDQVKYKGGRGDCGGSRGAQGGRGRHDKRGCSGREGRWEARKLGEGRRTNGGTETQIKNNPSE